MSRKMNLKDSFKKLDIFGEGIKLLINKQASAKTLIGGILTVFLYFTLLVIFIVMSLDIFQKEKPSITVENRILTSRPNLTLDKHSFPFAFTLQDGYNINYNFPKYFYVELLQVQIINTDNGVITNSVYYSSENCTPSHFPTLSNETFYFSGLQNYKCVKDQNITVGGYYDEQYVQYIGINLKACRNSSERSVICAPEEEIKDFFINTTLYFSIFFQNTIINSQNFKNFVNPYIVNKYKGVKYGTLKNFEMYLKNQLLHSDNGFLMEFYEDTDVITYDYDDYDFADMDADGYLCSYFFFSSYRKEIYRRNYLKIQFVLSQTGALGEIFIRLFGFICYIFTTTALNKHILNKIYDFDLIKKDNNKQNEKSKVLKSMTLHQLFNANNQISEHQNTSKVLDNNFVGSNSKNILTKKINESILKSNQTKDFKDQSNILYIIKNESEKNHLSFTYYEIIKMYLCCGIADYISEKKNLYEKSKKSLEEYLDISYIIQKLEEMEKMKLILLSYDQLAVFNFISKDFCSLNETKEEESTINRFKEFNKDTHKLSETILRFKKKVIENSDDLTEIDKKLYDLLREDLKQ